MSDNAPQAETPAQREAEIRARLAAVTPGEWRYEQIAECVFSEREDDFPIAICDVGSDWMKDDDGWFIASAPVDVRTLLDALDQARQQRDAAVGALKMLVDDTREADWFYTPDGIQQAVAAVLLNGSDKTKRYREALARAEASADDPAEG